MSSYLKYSVEIWSGPGALLVLACLIECSTSVLSMGRQGSVIVICGRCVLSSSNKSSIYLCHFFYTFFFVRNMIVVIFQIIHLHTVSVIMGDFFSFLVHVKFMMSSL